MVINQATFFQQFFFSGLHILNSWTLNRRICIDMKYFVHEARPKIINFTAFHLTVAPIIEREPRTFIHVKRAKRFDPVG